MKKTQAIILLLALLLTSGCSSNATSQVPNEPLKEMGTGLGPENAYVLSIDADTMVVPQAASTESSNDLSNYDNILSNSTDIIYGVVESVENFNGAGGTAWVKEQVRVLESYKGQLSPEAEITVIQQTGFISLNDYINSYVKEDQEAVRNMMLQNISDEEASNMVLDQTRGVPLDQVGDKIVFCLWISPQSTEKITYYEPVGDWAGKQVDMGNSTFAQYYPVENNTGKAAGENYEARSAEEMRELLKIH